MAPASQGTAAGPGRPGAAFPVTSDPWAAAVTTGRRGSLGRAPADAAADALLVRFVRWCLFDY
ncbi:hypothetical protein SCATT_53650 [Streptantibioticus cattleyicolor NRRL 8057 = DSM 46488]|uniref:Uncharacterized protein n=1 Tax=Streptantibioticus cattleyicolor (strain ATCC 35852 / DSM 46488 / JCM 4925 / NBRC 14057 / NRRL 8057) TaxID=1003195 RepID=G8X3Y1_STREN|nr:hypothetical protein SCATT_53650 [Streptantibioticus cattleyicolor NRRL 8057 = DSM 46488]